MREMGFSSASKKDYHITHNNSWVLKLVVAVLRTSFHSVVVITDSAPRAEFHYTLLYLDVLSISPPSLRGQALTKWRAAFQPFPAQLQLSNGMHLSMQQETKLHFGGFPLGYWDQNMLCVTVIITA
jgi:hypothetical protein